MVTYMTRTSARRAAGFTLLDSLIAVVVLATGILALTLLQTSMLRNAADARERSIAMALAQNLLEEGRSRAAQTQANYQGLATSGVFASGACDYAAGGALVPPGATGLQTDFRYCVSVQRYRATGSTFSAVATSGSGAPTYGSLGVVPEFKQITIDIGWRKNDGTWGQLRLGDALSGIPLTASNDLQNRPITAGAVQAPAQVKYDLNSLTSNTNFIPIAVGDGTGNSVAATNPTPKVIGGGIAETSFQVFTYSGANGYANVQREIDTKIVGCSCTSRNAPNLLTPENSTTTETFLTRPLRASYWNGLRFSEPAPATYPTTDLIGQENSARVGQQSPLCDVCCRDHEDPASVDYTGNSGEQDDIPKFDPFRASHDHYRDPSDSTTLVSVAGQNYPEVCRVVRVDGVYRVTQDPQIDHYAYIPTDGNGSDYKVTGSTAGYQAFVQSYMDARILPLSGYDWATNRANVSALENSNGLNSQAASAIDVYQSDRRYIQNRALLIDPLSYAAKQNMQNCIDQTGTGSPTDLACALRHTSFSSVNLTELTNWSVVRAGSATTDPITVVPKNFSVSTPTGAPVAGQVRDKSGAVNNTSADAVGTVNRFIATLADKVVQFYQASATTLTDRQSYRYVGGTRPSVKFTVTVAGLSYFGNNDGNSAAPYIGWRSGTGMEDDCVRITGTTSFECDLFDSTNAANVTLVLFNYYTQARPANNGAVCGSGNNAQKADLPKCDLYRPTSIVPGTFSAPAWRTSSTTGLPSSDGATQALGSVANGATYTVTFEAGATLSATFSCAPVTNQPVLSFQSSDCRRAVP